MGLIDCIVKSGLADDERLKKLSARIKELTDSGKHPLEAEAIAKTEFINEQHDALNNELNGLKKQVGVKSSKREQFAPDFTQANKKFQEAQNPPPPPEAPKEVIGGSEENNVGVHHEALKDISKRLGLKEPERGQRLSPQETADRGRLLLNNGADVKQIIEDFKNGKQPTADDISVVRAHLENLAKQADKIAKEKGFNSDEYKKASKEIEDLIQDVAKPMGTRASEPFTALQGIRDVDTDSFTVVKQQVEERQGRPTSEAQNKKIEELTNQNEALKKRAEEAEAKLVQATEDSMKGSEEPTQKKTATEKAKDVANKLRKAKFHRPDSFSAASPATIVWDGAVEVVAKSIEAGGKVADAIAEGVKFIKQSAWYQSLSEDKKAKAEKDFSDWHNEQLAKKLSSKLEDLQDYFVDKTDDKFSTDEAKSVWEYAKKNYLDKGMSFMDMISKVADDLGLSRKQVAHAITSPKVKRISDEMWKKQGEYRRNQIATKEWIEKQNQSAAVRAFKKVSGAFRSVAVFGHGGIFMGTHAGMNLFMPSTWKTFIPAFFRGWKYAYLLGKTGRMDYETEMMDLKARPNYITAQRAGLKNNPDVLNVEEYQKSQSGILKHAGERGFNAIKVFRQDLFDAYYNRLSPQEKSDPNSAKSIARLVNLATGATNTEIPGVANEVFFAAGMEVSRWQKLTKSPLEATNTALRILGAKVGLGDASDIPVEDRVFAKIWARRVGEQLATFIGILGANAALQTLINPKNPVNMTNPNQSDFLKFKFGNTTIDPTSGMVSTFNFIVGLTHIATESQKDLHGDTRLKAFGKGAFSYGRGKLSPFYSTVADVATQSDFYGNPIPFSSDKPATGKHKLGLIEYAWQKAPLPVAETAKVVYQSAEDEGTDKFQLHQVLRGVGAGMFSMSTGFRIGESHEKQTPFTDEDKKDPTFKYFLDRGMELPNVQNKNEEIKDEESKTIKKITEFPKEVQDSYNQVHKNYLKEVLGDVKDNGEVYVKTYTTIDGHKSVVSLTPTKDSDEKSLDKLSKEEMAQVLSLAQKEATKRAKKEIFNE